MTLCGNTPPNESESDDGGPLAYQFSDFSSTTMAYYGTGTPYESAVTKCHIMPAKYAGLSGLLTNVCLHQLDMIHCQMFENPHGIQRQR